jgi:hypothetical protein
MPQRVQLSRKKGWRMPPNTVKVSRPTQWGNPFIVGERTHRDSDGHVIAADYAVEMFRFTTCPVEGRTGIFTTFEGGEIDLRPLRGKNLACWCRLDQPCHADVLLELANPVGEG